MTNSVAAEFAANALLALGAVPAIIQDADEAAEFAASANALMINLGTLFRPQMDAMRRAIATAKKANNPWVLDLVAVGVLRMRSKFAQEIADSGPAIIRGKASEILTLAGGVSGERSPETDPATEAALRLSRRTGAVVWICGVPDQIIAEGVRYYVRNSHPNMAKIIGSSCAPGAVTAAAAAVADNAVKAAVGAAVITGVAGEIAGEKSGGTGTFAAAYLDALGNLNADILFGRARIAR